MLINKGKLPSNIIKKITNDLFEAAGGPKNVTIEQHNHATIQAIIQYLDENHVTNQTAK